MFCAGLLLSIADLLVLLNCGQNTYPLTKQILFASRLKYNNTFPRFHRWPQEQGGILAVAHTLSLQKRAIRQTDASTIRRSPPLFNREVALRGRDFNLTVPIGRVQTCLGESDRTSLCGLTT